MIPPKKPLRIIYIAGFGRCGSTLLARALGQLDGVINIGEATRCLLHTRMFERLNLCGCGETISRCEFWGELLKRIPVQDREAATRLLRTRNLMPLFSQVVGCYAGDDFVRIGTTLESLLQGIHEKSGCHTIIDASKNPALAQVLGRIPGVELHIIHLVRDSRSVAASWSQPKEYLRRHHEVKVACWWFAHNLASERLSSIAASYVRLKYEDAFLALREVILSIQKISGFNSPIETIFRDDHVFLGDQHTIAGNPDRFETGWVQVRVRPGPGEFPGRRMVTALTWPLLLRYGYFGSWSAK